MSEQANERVIRDVLKHIKMPTDVLSFDLSFSEDSSGAPAVWVLLQVKDDYKPSEEKVNRFKDLRAKIMEGILEKNLPIWPHVRLIAD